MDWTAIDRCARAVVEHFAVNNWLNPAASLAVMNVEVGRVADIIAEYDDKDIAQRMEAQRMEDGEQ